MANSFLEAVNAADLTSEILWVQPKEGHKGEIGAYKVPEKGPPPPAPPPPADIRNPGRAADHLTLDLELSLTLLQSWKM